MLDIRQAYVKTYGKSLYTDISVSATNHVVLTVSGVFDCLFVLLFHFDVMRGLIYIGFAVVLRVIPPGITRSCC